MARGLWQAHGVRRREPLSTQNSVISVPGFGRDDRAAELGGASSAGATDATDDAVGLGPMVMHAPNAVGAIDATSAASAAPGPPRVPPHDACEEVAPDGRPTPI